MGKEKPSGIPVGRKTLTSWSHMEEIAATQRWPLALASGCDSRLFIETASTLDGQLALEFVSVYIETLWGFLEESSVSRDVDKR